MSGYDIDFRCKSCGGQLSHDESKELWVCNSCGNMFDIQGNAIREIGLSNISNLLLRAEQFLALNEFIKALGYVDKAKDIDINNPKIADMENRINTAKANYLSAKETLDAIEKAEKEQMERKAREIENAKKVKDELINKKTEYVNYDSLRGWWASEDEKGVDSYIFFADNSIIGHYLLYSFALTSKWSALPGMYVIYDDTLCFFWIRIASSLKAGDYGSKYDYKKAKHLFDSARDGLLELINNEIRIFNAPGHGIHGIISNAVIINDAIKIPFPYIGEYTSGKGSPKLFFRIDEEHVHNDVIDSCNTLIARFSEAKQMEKSKRWAENGRCQKCGGELYLPFGIMESRIPTCRNCGNKEKTASYKNVQSSSCYIATAVYGSYNAPQVLALRQYRDTHLSKTVLGRLFIKAYYCFSPPVARWMKDKRRINCSIQRVLDHLIKRIKKRKEG